MLLVIDDEMLLNAFDNVADWRVAPLTGAWGIISRDGGGIATETLPAMLFQALSLVA